MLSVYATSDTTRVSLARVATAISSFAKSLWNQQEDTCVQQEMPTVFSLDDPERQIQAVRLSPKSPLFPFKPAYAALVDNLGRVSVLDVQQGEIFCLFKGQRNAQTGWMHLVDPEDQKLYLFLVVYSSRGTVEIFLMRSVSACLCRDCE